MDRKIKLEASIACANFARLEDDVAQLAAAGVDYLHFDFMDGRFVHNFGLDYGILRTIRQLTTIPLDCHLMVEDPERYVRRTAEAGAQYITVHFEATRHVQRTLQEIRGLGARAAIALNPATPITILEYILDDIDMVTVMMVNPGFAGQTLVPAMLRKVKEVRFFLDERGYKNVEIQVDGNVSFEQIPAMVEAGATMLVGGTSSIFHKSYSIGKAVAAVREIVKGAAQKQMITFQSSVPESRPTNGGPR
jgi:ribulose-phosphate 3-epimerase